MRGTRISVSVGGIDGRGGRPHTKLPSIMPKQIASTKRKTKGDGWDTHTCSCILAINNEICCSLLWVPSLKHRGKWGESGVKVGEGVGHGDGTASTYSPVGCRVLLANFSVLQFSALSPFLSSISPAPGLHHPLSPPSCTPFPAAFPWPLSRHCHC